MTLNQSNIGTEQNQSNTVDRPNQAPTFSTRSVDKTPLPLRSSAPSFISAASSSTIRPRLHPNSLSLVLHFLSLRDYLLVARCCHEWYEAAISRLAWSGTSASVMIEGSREERRMKEEDENEKGGKAGHKNFNPKIMRLALEEASSISSSSSSSSFSSSSTPPADRRVSHPLEWCAVSCPLLRHVRHLIYTFAPPNIRTSIASMTSEDMFVTDVVEAQFPFANLPPKSFPFMSSLILRQIPVCSQMSVQAAFHRFGIQSHSFLRALELNVSTFLSENEKSRTLISVLTEVGAQLTNLEILSMPQRGLPLTIRLEPLLTLHKLHTLVFHSSLAKTPERVMVIRHLGLHGNLKYLKWGSWNVRSMKHMFGEIDADENGDDNEVNRLLDGVTLDDGASLDDDEAIGGLDDEEEAFKAAPANGSLPSSSRSMAFRFREWTIDNDVAASSFTHYFGARPAILPQLDTLYFMLPNRFAEFTPTLSMNLSTLPSLTAVCIHMNHYGLGRHFWHHLTSTSLPSLKRLRIDQIGLVTLKEGSTSHDDNDAVYSLVNWSSFPSLTELTLSNSPLPPLHGLAHSAPRLRELHLEHVNMARSCDSVGSTSLRELMVECQQMRQLQRLTLLHVVGVQSSMIEDMLQWVVHSDTLESLHLCTRSDDMNHISSHRHDCAFLRDSFRSVANTPLVVSAIEASPPTISGPLSHPTLSTQPNERTNTGKFARSANRGVKMTQLARSIEYEALYRLHQSTHAARRHRLNQSSLSHIHPIGSGLTIHYWDAESSTQRMIPGERLASAS